MELNPRRLLLQDAFATTIADDPIVLVDVGARGGLDPPWSSLRPELLRIVGFEPDAVECERLSREHPDSVFLPYVLWSQPGKVNINVADVPACSSIHPPDQQFLGSFADRHVAPRATRSVTEYPATTLDAVVLERELTSDFVKIDTQGSELEIIEGASRTLESDALGVLVETWSAPVHAGQGLTGTVLDRLTELGLILFDVGVAAAWQRAVADRHPIHGRAQVVGMDLLLLRDVTTSSLNNWRASRVAKLAAIADIFGFPDYAVEVLEAGAAGLPQEAAELNALRRLVLDAAAEPTSSGLAGRALRRLLGRGGKRDFAPLHA